MVRVFATISMLCAGASARRNEETTGFVQIKEMKADLSQMSYLEDVKTSLKKMALNRASVPQEAMGAIEEITNKLRDILPPLGDERDNDSADQQRILGLFSASEQNYTTAMDAANDESVSTSLWSLQDTARTTYEQCRATESVELGEKNVCIQQQGEKQGTFDEKVEAVKNAALGATDTTCDPSDDDIYAFTTSGNVQAVNAYHNAIDELISAKSDLATKTGECDEHTGNYNTQHDTCDGDQNDLEDAACNWARAYASAASTYSSGYSSASEDYDSGKDRWESNNANRKAQCELVAKITCYVTALKEENEQTALEAAIEACDQEGDGEDAWSDFNCPQYVLTIENKPEEITLQTTPATHCDQEFDYGSTPADTSLGEQQACCTLN